MPDFSSWLRRATFWQRIRCRLHGGLGTYRYAGRIWRYCSKHKVTW